MARLLLVLFLWPPSGEREGGGEIHVDLAIATLALVGERPSAGRQMHVGPGADVLVRMDPRPVVELELEHPHEPSGVVPTDGGDQRVPQGLLVLDDLPGDRAWAAHA